MRRALPYVAFAVAAALGFAIITPDPEREGLRYRDQLDRDPVVRAERALLDARQDSLRALEGTLERVEAREKAGRLVRASGGRGALLTADAGVDAPSRRAFAEGVQRELGSFGAAPLVPVRVHLVSEPTRSPSYWRFIVLPESTSDPCVVLIQLHDPPGRQHTPIPGDRLIGTCAFYARFGHPGAGMRDWLLETNGRFATTDLAPPTPPRAERYRFSGTEVLQAPPVAACLAGQDDPCVDAFFRYSFLGRVLPLASAPGARGVFRAYPGWNRYTPFTNLALLLDHLGEERFARLWGSERAPDAAYEQLEGRHLADFVRAEFEKELEPHHPGPLQAGLPLVLGGALAVGCGIWAIRGTRRMRS